MSTIGLGQSANSGLMMSYVRVWYISVAEPIGLYGSLSTGRRGRALYCPMLDEFEVELSKAVQGDHFTYWKVLIES